MDVDWRTTLVGFGAALVVLGLLVGFVGIGRVLDALSRADPAALAAVLGVATAWMISWGLSLRTVLGILGSAVSAPVAVLVFTAATFANNVTPFGQAGGEPVTALFISRAADTEYETGLAAIASVDSLNFVPSILLALAGIGYFSVTVAFGRRLQYAAVAVVVLAVAIPAAGYYAWHNRYRVEAGVVRLLTPIIRGLGRMLPRRAPPDGHVIEARIEGFFHAIERVTGDRRGLATALGFSTLGWLCLAGSLWLSLRSLGYPVPFAATLVVVPVGAIAGITPLPGGLGGVETVLVALLVPTTGVSVAGATAAVVIHRTATYWLPVLVGGGTAAAIGVGGVLPTPEEHTRKED
ncbi:MAG: lysylphosphatidylglycerol synthase transmembrane domain-containing protein [Haloarculaceae archaeon]